MFKYHRSLFALKYGTLTHLIVNVGLHHQKKQGKAILAGFVGGIEANQIISLAFQKSSLLCSLIDIQQLCFAETETVTRLFTVHINGFLQVLLIIAHKASKTLIKRFWTYNLKFNWILSRSTHTCTCRRCNASMVQGLGRNSIVQLFIWKWDLLSHSNTCTDEKWDVNGEKHNTEWITCNQKMIFV